MAGLIPHLQYTTTTTTSIQKAALRYGEMDCVSKWIIANATKFYWFSIVLSVPSTLLYIGEIFTILKNKKLFGNSFFWLFCVRGISDILMLAASCYGNRLPSLFGPALLPIYRALPNWSLALFYFSTTFTYQVSNIATAFILLNRFTAIAFPLHHKKLWQRFFWLLLGLMLVVPSLACYPVMRMEATLTLQNDTAASDGTFVIIEKGPTRTYLDYSNWLKSATSIIFLLLCFLINLSTMIAYKRHKTAANVRQHQNIERKLFIYSLLTFFGHAVLALFLLIVSAFVWPFYPQYNAIIYIQYPWITDLCTLVLSSWMLLFTSYKFRRQFVNDTLLLLVCHPKRCFGGLLCTAPNHNANNIIVPMKGKNFSN